MSKENLYYPQKLGRTILLGMEEVIGRSGVDSILQLASLDFIIQERSTTYADKTFSFETVSLLQSTLEQKFGPRGGHGLALRVGRATFNHGVKEYGSMLGLTELTFRLLPLSTKLHSGATIFSDFFNRHTDQKVRVEETKNEILWHIECCPLCWQREAKEPVCYLAVGVLQEALYWLSGGKIFNVEEVDCIAKGDSSCMISINKEPID